MITSAPGPARGWGVPKSLEELNAAYRRVSHAQNFFRCGDVLNTAAQIKPIKSRIISMAGVLRPRSNRVFFIRGRGEVKVSSIAIPDRWARRAHLFGQFRKHFFGRAAGELWKFAAKFGVGG